MKMTHKLSLAVSLAGLLLFCSIAVHAQAASEIKSHTLKNGVGR